MAPILEVQNVNKRFGGLKALDDVNLTVEEGSVHAIIGPNGAGKSTLLNCFVGRLIPDTGAVTFAGRSLIGRKPHEINQMGVSRVFQTPEIFEDLTVLENVMIPALASRDGAFRMHGWAPMSKEAELRDKALHTLEDVNMADRKGVEARHLSRGDKRRLEMAMCLVQDPKREFQFQHHDHLFRLRAETPELRQKWLAHLTKLVTNVSKSQYIFGSVVHCVEEESAAGARSFAYLKDGALVLCPAPLSIASLDFPPSAGGAAAAQIVDRGVERIGADARRLQGLARRQDERDAGPARPAYGRGLAPTPSPRRRRASRAELSRR